MSNGNGGPLEEAQKFGLKLIAWMENAIGLRWIKLSLSIDVNEPLSKALGERVRAMLDWWVANPEPWNNKLALAARWLFTGNAAGDEDKPLTLSALTSDPAQFLYDVLGQVFSNPVLRKQFEVLGGAVFDTSVATITGDSPPRQSEAADRARAFVGFVTALGAAPQLLAMQTEAGSGGQIDQIGSNIQNVFWNLGLGFLTWQTMAPILQASILEPLTEDVQKQWRGQRFTRPELQELFALGKITRDQMGEEQARLGWRDEDIDKVIELSYNVLSRGDAIDLWHKGIWTEDQCATHLRRLGYKPEDVELIMRLEDREDVINDRTESISILSTSFEDGLLPEEQFRAALDAQGYTAREIDLRIQLIRFRQQDKARKISVAQLNDAWTENIVGDQQVIKTLIDMGYAEDEVSIILDTWKAKLLPDFLRINQSTILDMYRFGIFSRDDAIKRLESIGYNHEDAVAQVDLLEAKFPEAFGAAPPRKQRMLSLGAVSDLYAMGRLTEDDLKQWVTASGFSVVDQENMILLITTQAQGGVRPLSQSTIIDAYITGVFTRDAALQALRQIGFDADDADTVLKTAEAQNPAVFNPGQVSSLRQPTIGALVQAVQSGFISEQQFFEKANLIGFNREGALLYLENARAKLVKSSKKLTKADVLEFFRKNLMSYPEAFKELNDMGYSERDSDLLLRSETKGVKATDIWSALLAGFLDPQDAFVALMGLGFTEDEINAAISEQFPE